MMTSCRHKRKRAGTKCDGLKKSCILLLDIIHVKLPVCVEQAWNGRLLVRSE